MNIGTKSVLYGAHCFFIHPFFVALGWWVLYGFSPVPDPYLGTVSLKDPRLWLAFFLHDLGYWGKPNMDGPEGERHPVWAARMMDRLTGDYRWWEFMFYHSRFLAKRDGKPYSMLCVADKMSVPLEPWWLYLPRVVATGEVHEYRSLAKVMNPSSKYAGEPDADPTTKNRWERGNRSHRAWFENMTEYMLGWVIEHRDGKQDTWTPVTEAGKREIEDISGTYR